MDPIESTAADDAGSGPAAESPTPAGPVVATTSADLTGESPADETVVAEAEAHTAARADEAVSPADGGATPVPGGEVTATTDSADVATSSTPGDASTPATDTAPAGDREDRKSTRLNSSH